MVSELMNYVRNEDGVPVLNKYCEVVGMLNVVFRFFSVGDSYYGFIVGRDMYEVFWLMDEFCDPWLAELVFLDSAKPISVCFKADNGTGGLSNIRDTELGNDLIDGYMEFNVYNSVKGTAYFQDAIVYGSNSEHRKCLHDVVGVNEC